MVEGLNVLGTFSPRKADEKLAGHSTCAVHHVNIHSMTATVCYSSEQTLVESFLEHLQTEVTPWGPLDVGVEFFYQRGRVDVVALATDGEVVAFEAKLTRWRDALQQAYRNNCLAHRSYVLLPQSTAIIALQYGAEFTRRRVGLCYVAKGEIVVLYDPPRAEPLQPWLTAEAAQCAASGGIRLAD